jgi:hypothetical protein
MFRTYCIAASLAILASLAGATGCSSSTKPGESTNDDSGGSSSSSGGSGEGGGEESGTGCTAVVSTANLTTPTVSLKTDILPIFQISCGISGSTCHGMFQGGMQNLYLAEQLSAMDGDGDAGAIVKGIVGVKSVEDPSMNIVTAGDPTNSFLMHKIDGDQCTLASQCEAPDGAIFMGNTTVPVPCGQNMPYLNSMLTTAELDTIRRWIAQGAMDN